MSKKVRRDDQRKAVLLSDSEVGCVRVWVAWCVLGLGVGILGWATDFEKSRGAVAFADAVYAILPAENAWPFARHPDFVRFFLSAIFVASPLIGYSFYKCLYRHPEQVAEWIGWKVKNLSFYIVVLALMCCLAVFVNAESMFGLWSDGPSAEPPRGIAGAMNKWEAAFGFVETLNVCAFWYLAFYAAISVQYWPIIKAKREERG